MKSPSKPTARPDRGLVRKSRRRARAGAAGAVAIEFALILPVLCTLVFGMIDYGLWLNDSLTVRQGVREAARRGVVENYAGSSCPTASSDMAKLACITRDQIGSVGGPTYVKIIVPSTGWKRTAPLTVCAMVAYKGVIGIVPLPSDGLIRSKTTMSIEVGTPSVPAGSTITGTPAGGDWTWCS